MSKQMPRPTTPKNRWLVTLVIAGILALASPAFVVVGPEGIVTLRELTYYFPLGFMLLDVFGPEGVAYAVCYMPQFLAYFVIFVVICRVLLALVRSSKLHAA